MVSEFVIGVMLIYFAYPSYSDYLIGKGGRCFQYNSYNYAENCHLAWGQPALPLLTLLSLSLIRTHNKLPGTNSSLGKVRYGLLD